MSRQGNVGACRYHLPVAQALQFFPRNAMSSADYAVARYLSVGLSVTCRYYVETAKHILKLLSPLGIHSRHSSYSIPNGMVINSLTGALNARDMKQEAQLSQRDRATLTVVEYFAKSLKITQGHSKRHCSVGRV